MSSHDIEAFAAAWLRAWNDRDLEAILTHYADDIELRSPLVVHLLGEASGSVSGKQKLRDYFARVLEAFPGKPEAALLDVSQGVASIVVHFQFNGGTGAELMELTADGMVRRAIAHVRAEPERTVG
jgi:ketosteroid isomerase-like protein